MSQKGRARLPASGIEVRDRLTPEEEQRLLALRAQLGTQRLLLGLGTTYSGIDRLMHGGRAVPDLVARVREGIARLEAALPASCDESATNPTS